MPPAAPVVQSLQDLVGQYTTATAPQNANYDTEEAANESSGTAQQSGLASAQDAAFTKIAGEANARGATFSGFTPNAEANYTGSTYLPALAKLQTAIATTRGQILGDKATLASNNNTAALSTQKTEQGALDTYNEDQANQQAEEQRQQEAEAATAAEDQRAQAATASEDAQTRAEEESVANANASAAASKASQASLNTAAGQVAAELNKVTGGDGYVSPNSYAAGKKAFESQGYTGAQFDSLLAGYRNPANKNYALG